MKPARGDVEFERLLERELQRTLGAAQGPSPRAAQAAYWIASRTRGGASLTIRPGVLGSLMSKGAVGLVAAALAVGGGGAVIAAAATGSANPMNWGQQVREAVEACKAPFADHSRSDAFADAHTGGRNVGQCVSAFAQGHGDQQQATHGEKRESGSTATPTPTAHGESGVSHGQGSDASQDRSANSSEHSSGHGKPSPKS